MKRVGRELRDEVAILATAAAFDRAARLVRQPTEVPNRPKQIDVLQRQIDIIKKETKNETD